MQTVTLKGSEVARNVRVVRIRRVPSANRRRRRRVVPSAALHRPPSKGTVVAAFILSVILHAGAVMWVEMQQEKQPLEVDASVLTHPMEKVISETAAETDTTSAPGTRTAVD